MNDTCLTRWKGSWRPIWLDNDSGNDASEWIEGQGVPIESAVAQLISQVLLFNPSKHGKNDLPRSLSYFKRGIVSAWRREAQLSLPLLASETGRQEERRVYGKPKSPEHIGDSLKKYVREA